MAEVGATGVRVSICPSCGEENPAKFRICGMCGSPLAPVAPVQEVRKTVTIVFSDLVGSTALGEALDSETLREVLSSYFNEVSGIIHRHGGTLEKFIGDAVMAVFGLPRAHEDDALRAVRAVDEVQQSLARLNERLESRWGVRLRNRTGINTGEVVAGDVTIGQRLVTGDAVNLAARLEQATPPLEVLLSHSTYRIVRDAVQADELPPISVKGKSKPVRVYLLRGVGQQDALVRRVDTPIVAREAELRDLEQEFATAIAVRAPRLVVASGQPGVGKSRLLHEFVVRISQGARALRGRCLSYGDGITFWPLRDIVREAAGITDDDSLEDARKKLAVLVPPGDRDVVERIESAVGLTDKEFPVQEMFWAARKLLEALAEASPLVLVVEDVHWAERTFLDLIRYLLESLEAVPAVIVCSSRPELLEEPEGRDLAGCADRVLRLDPLSYFDSATVLENVLGTADVADDVRDKVVEAAGGNPLFVEQIVSMLVEEGHLKRDDGGRWHLGLLGESVVIPPSISALLAARLDHLPPLEHALIQHASVVGATFSVAAVQALLPPALRAGVPAMLDDLVRKELVARGQTLEDGDSFRFAHGLIREAAYHTMLKKTRAELHERLVGWAEASASDRVTEYEEIRGYHLEQAYLTRLQLGPLDDHAVNVGRRAGRYLRSAGDRAHQRADMHAAANLLRRAAAVLPPDDPARAQLHLHCGEALLELGEFPLADSILTAAAEEAAAAGRHALATSARLVRRQLRYAAMGEGSEAELLATIARAVEQLEAAGEHAGLARAWRLAWLVQMSVCRYAEAERSAEKTIHHAHLAGDRVMETRLLSSLAMCALYGPMPVPDAIALAEDLVAKAKGDRKALAIIHLTIARLKAMRGDFESARRLYTTSREWLEELGWKFHAALTSIISGPVEMSAGDLDKAVSELKRDYDTLWAMGERNYISTTAAWLAVALCERERWDEADKFAKISADIASVDDISSQFLWRCGRARVLARRGFVDEAEDVARQAVKIVGRSDDLDGQGRALAVLAEVLALSNRHGEARDVTQEALARLEEKGNLVAVETVRTLLANLCPTV